MSQYALIEKSASGYTFLMISQTEILEALVRCPSVNLSVADSSHFWRTQTFGIDNLGI